MFPIHCCLTVECSDGNVVDVSTTKRLTTRTAIELRDYLDVYISCLRVRAERSLKLPEMPAPQLEQANEKESPDAK